MRDSKRLSRIVIVIVAIATGLAFIGLAIYGLNFPVDEILFQLILVGILLFVLLALAALTAWGIRCVINTMELRRQKQFDENDSE
ncbi:hypothetical protein [Aurantivibrio infirmus]